jgi:hypothetical protein
VPPEAWGSPASSGANIEETPTSAAWLWESSASKVVAIILKAAGVITAGLLATNEEAQTSAAWGLSASPGAADAKLMPNVEFTKADPLAANEETPPSEACGLSARSGVVDVETSSSVASGERVAVTGEMLAAGESGGAARRAKLAPSAFSGSGEASSSADAVLAGDGAPGEGDVNMAMWTPRPREQTGNRRRR